MWSTIRNNTYFLTRISWKIGWLKNSLIVAGMAAPVYKKENADTMQV